MTSTHLNTLMAFERWANLRTLNSVRRAAEGGQTVRLLGHIHAAQEVWLTRLQGGESAAVPVWPDSSLEKCAERMTTLEAELESFVDGLEESSLDQEIVYRNQSGREFRNTPRDILTHLTMHSQHHRGQIALELRQLGEEPAVTDFIAFRREE